jgi:hypothetical protein
MQAQHKLQALRRKKARQAGLALARSVLSEPCEEESHSKPLHGLPHLQLKEEVASGHQGSSEKARLAVQRPFDQVRVIESSKYQSKRLNATPTISLSNVGADK